jgi:hypothetical protein
MIKYTPSNQLTLVGFSHPFDQELSTTNRWVKLAKIIPWDALAAVYSKSLNTTCGRESIDVRMVIGAIIIKHKLDLDDRGTVAMISENIYLQYFCGLTSLQTQEPFHPTVFVDIRKRMGIYDFDLWNALIIKKADDLKPKKKKMISPNNEDDEDDEDDYASQKTALPKNKGTLKIDATVANHKIVYPTDAGLLNTARKETERFIDLLYKQSAIKKPRDYRRIARTEYLVFSKKRRKSKKEIRKFIGKQLNYVKRNLTYIKKLLDNIEGIKTAEVLVEIFPMKNPHPSKFPLPKRDQKIYWVVQHLYVQQRYMYQEKIHSVKDRIVNIYQPYVRPIPRGKDKASTEFGAKISASVVDGMTRVEHLSWDQFNEASDLELQVNMYTKTFGQYPELVLADQIYLNRKNRNWLKEKGIRIVGKPLGRPKKVILTAYQKRKLKKERNQRNHIEGKFGQAKNAYGLSSIKAKRSDTSQSWIGAIFFVMNLISLGKIAEQYAIFCALFKKWSAFTVFRLTKVCFCEFSTTSYNPNQKYRKLKLKCP